MQLLNILTEKRIPLTIDIIAPILLSFKYFGNIFLSINPPCLLSLFHDKKSANPPNVLLLNRQEPVGNCFIRGILKFIHFNFY
jgi:hypothetical protein